MHRRISLVAIGLAGLLAAPAGAQSPGKPVVVLVGPPASGKSTQAEFLKKKYGFTVISREQLMQDDPGQFKGQAGIQGMEPRMDPALNRLFQARLENTTVEKGLLLDGYPGSMNQADFLAKALQERGMQKPLVLQLEVPDEVTRARRKDVSPALVEQDLKDYHREMDFLTSYFPNADIVKIDANRKSSSVSKEIAKAMKERYQM